MVGNKGNKQWIWLVISRNTRDIVWMQYIGDRSREGVRALWASFVWGYLQCGVCYTFWEASQTVLPEK